MQRRLASILVSLSLFGLSCEIPTTRALPPVAAAAPATEALLDDADSESAVNDPMLAIVIDRFASRREMGLTSPEIETLAHAILDASKQYDIDPSLVLAVIHVESRYDAFAVSPVGALGLMQILPSTGRELAARHGVDWTGPQTLFDPVSNVRLGVAYLKQLSDRYGSTSMALAAYNWGPGRIDRRLRSGTPMPTIYPGLVLQAYSAQRERRS
jgi:soluble lytic murein transglycosylase-like protein